MAEVGPRTGVAGRLKPALLLCLSLSCWQAEAACSRLVQVPVAATGFNVVVDEENRVSGVYPDLLRKLGEGAGCQFAFPIRPRARQVMMFFESHEADLFIPASRNAERDQKATFLPMLRLTPALITLRSRPEIVTELRALLAKSTWRAALVRSYSWGDEYEAATRQLEAEQRIDYVADLRAVGAMLRSGRVQFTILPPTLLYSALQQGEAKAGDDNEFRYTALDGLPRSEVGAYISRQALPPADFNLLSNLLARGARDGSLMRALERYYPAWVLKSDVQLLK